MQVLAWVAQKRQERMEDKGCAIGPIKHKKWTHQHFYKELPQELITVETKDTYLLLSLCIPSVNNMASLTAVTILPYLLDITVFMAFFINDLDSWIYSRMHDSILFTHVSTVDSISVTKAFASCCSKWQIAVLSVCGFTGRVFLCFVLLVCLAGKKKKLIISTLHKMIWPTPPFPHSFLYSIFT